MPFDRGAAGAAGALAARHEQMACKCDAAKPNSIAFWSILRAPTLTLLAWTIHVDLSTGVDANHPAKPRQHWAADR